MERCEIELWRDGEREDEFHQNVVEEQWQVLNTAIHTLHVGRADSGIMTQVQ